MGGSHAASASSQATSTKKGPKRPQPLAPFAKYANAPGPLRPWEGGLVLIDGSAAGLVADGPTEGGTVVAATAAGAAAGQAGGATGAAGTGGGMEAAGAAAAGGDAQQDLESLREENERWVCRHSLGAVCRMCVLGTHAVRWTKLSGRLAAWPSRLLSQRPHSPRVPSCSAGSSSSWRGRCRRRSSGARSTLRCSRCAASCWRGGDAPVCVEPEAEGAGCRNVTHTEANYIINTRSRRAQCAVAHTGRHTACVSHFRRARTLCWQVAALTLWLTSS